MIRKLTLVLGTVGVVLMLPEMYVYVTTQVAESVPLPGPGLTTRLEVNNRGFPAAFGDKFALTDDVVVEPTASVDMPQRSPIRCRFQLSKNNAIQLKPIAFIDQLHHASDHEYAHIATFVSDLFEMPRGTTSVSLTNLGCDKGIPFVGGVARIGAVGEHLMVPMEAWILWWVGAVSLIVGLALEIFGSARLAAAARE